MKVISVTGGKGGIGKTTISVNLAVALAKSGKRVLLFDADLGLANVDVMLGLKPERTVQDFLEGKCSLSETCVKGPFGITIIPASSGIHQLADLSGEQAASLIHEFSTLSNDYDVMLVDLASGISRQVMDFTQAAQNIMVVICNEPSSMVDSYAVIKILHQRYGRNKFGIVINKVKHLQEGYGVYLRFQETISKFLNVNVEYLGYIPNDEYIAIAARDNASICDKYPMSPAAKALRDLQHGIVEWAQSHVEAGGIQYFFEKLVQSNHASELELCKP